MNPTPLEKLLSEFSALTANDFSASVVEHDALGYIQRAYAEGEKAERTRILAAVPGEKDERITTPRGGLALASVINSHHNEWRAELLKAINKEV